MYAAGEAVEEGCELGEELDLARSGLQAVDRLVDLERLARNLTKPDETAPSDELERLGREAQAQAEAARLAQPRRRSECRRRPRRRGTRPLPSRGAPITPESSGARHSALMPIRVQWPHGGQRQRRFEAGATLEQVRAWVVTAYPADAPTPLPPRPSGSRRRPMPPARPRSSLTRDQPARNRRGGLVTVEQEGS